MKNDSLYQIGLDDREINIYKALLRLGPASIRDVAAEAGVNRGTTYETLKQLATKGVVNYLPRGKRRVFQAEEPEQLLQLAERRQQ
ncbi:MAG: ArsR family transcriptional regulator, partial [Dechloromonas sp.]|nr:ArsR family transcriptional regulator [Dechloromonas sp.]